LVSADRTSERSSLLGVGDRLINAALGEADAERRERDPALVEDPQELRISAAALAEVKQAAAIAKLYSSEAAVSAARTATQVFGGNGFMEEYPVARFYRDAKILEIGEGTSEVQRMLIARGLGLPA
jgi:alkylation response protein AidB-like acyl-CoA dehydrogenase